MGSVFLNDTFSNRETPDGTSLLEREVQIGQPECSPVNNSFQGSGLAIGNGWNSSGSVLTTVTTAWPQATPLESITPPASMRWDNTGASDSLNQYDYVYATLTGHFYKGETYQARIRGMGNLGPKTVRMWMGINITASSSPDVADKSTVTSGPFQVADYTVEWTPKADYVGTLTGSGGPYVLLRVEDATPGYYYLDELVIRRLTTPREIVPAIWREQSWKGSSSNTYYFGSGGIVRDANAVSEGSVDTGSAFHGHIALLDTRPRVYIPEKNVGQNFTLSFDTVVNVANSAQKITAVGLWSPTDDALIFGGWRRNSGHATSGVGDFFVDKCGSDGLFSGGAGTSTSTTIAQNDRLRVDVTFRYEYGDYPAGWARTYPPKPIGYYKAWRLAVSINAWRAGTRVISDTIYKYDKTITPDSIWIPCLVTQRVGASSDTDLLTRVGAELSSMYRFQSLAGSVADGDEAPLAPEVEHILGGFRLYPPATLEDIFSVDYQVRTSSNGGNSWTDWEDLGTSSWEQSRGVYAHNNTWNTTSYAYRARYNWGSASSLSASDWSDVIDAGVGSLDPTSSATTASGGLEAPYIAIATSGSTFPSGPTHGQIHLYEIEEGTIWMFRYNATSSSPYKWEGLSCPPIHEEVDALESTSSTSYTDLSTDGPSVVVPLAGEYIIGADVGMSSGATNIQYVSVQIGTASTVDGDRVCQVNITGTGNQGSHSSGRIKREITPSGSVVKLQYRTSGASGSFDFRRMYIYPIRVAG